ncbi:MAG: ATP-dependent zinc metalloprotease FtsH [Eubacteriales bacterium]
MKGSNLIKIIMWIGVFAVCIAVASFLLGGGNSDKIKYDDIVGYFHNIGSSDENAVAVKDFTLTSKNQLTLELTDGKKVETVLQDRTRFYEDCWDYIFDENGNVRVDENGNALVEFDLEEPVTFPAWFSALPYIIILVVFIVFWVYIMKQAGGGSGSRINSFGKSRAKVTVASDKNKVLFTDVAGADEEKQELQEIVEFLKDPTKFTKLGAKIPHGVLLVGPPGTGKTLLAKAVAGEAGVPFYSISGSDFVEMYVGVGASRVRDLFDVARKNPASIVFIDEIDAVGRHRGAGLGGGHDEREQTLNQLLVEMDGFSGNEGVIVIAATNRPDILDPALLRPGRFDRQITVNYPDIRGREEILKVHAKNKPFEESVDLSVVARSTPGFTGADLANLLNEAALLAARRGKALIGMNDIEDATMKIILGTQKKSMRRKPDEMYKTAIHEAGHAVVCHLLPTQDPVHLITIIPSGRALGVTVHIPEDDQYSVYKIQLKEQIAVCMGGRVAEAISFDDISGGASGDIQQASEIARKMVTQYGMSDRLGPVAFGSGHTEVFLGRELGDECNYSEETARIIDEEVRNIINEAYALAESILRANLDKLKFVADFLMKNETMDEIQFKALMDNDPQPTMEELEAMMDERRRKSQAENEAQEARLKEKAAEEERLRKEKEREEAERERRRQEEMTDMHGNHRPKDFFSDPDDGPSDDNDKSDK